MRRENFQWNYLGFIKPISSWVVTVSLEPAPFVKKVY